MKSTPGVYRSDVEGHLFILGYNPLRVTCVPCAETCNRDSFKMFNDFRTAALAFVDKHGALDVKIADNIVEIINKIAKMQK